MGRCGSCRAQTSSFCFVHQEFVCYSCLVDGDARVHTRCVVSTYRKWVQDSSYEWPPECGDCHQELDAVSDNIRLMCLHVAHTQCVAKSAGPDHPCPTCQVPIKGSLMADSELSSAIQKQLKGVPWLADIAPPRRPDASPEAARAPIEASAQAFTAANVPESSRNLTESASVRVEQQASSVQVPVASKSMFAMPPPRPAQEAVVVATGQGKGTSLPRQEVDETRLDVGLPSGNRQGALKLSKSSSQTRRELGRTKGPSQISVRRVVKAGNRKWFELKKYVSLNRKRVALGIACGVCIILMIVLMWGDDDVQDIRVVEKKAFQERGILPNVRVNPAIVQRASEARTKEGVEIHEKGDPEWLSKQNKDPDLDDIAN